MERNSFKLAFPFFLSIERCKGAPTYRDGPFAPAELFGRGEVLGVAEDLLEHSVRVVHLFPHNLALEEGLVFERT